MRIENRELFVSFWDDEHQQGVYSLLIGWVGDDPATLLPVVAYNFGIREVSGAFELAVNLSDARKNATAIERRVRDRDQR